MLVQSPCKFMTHLLSHNRAEANLSPMLPIMKAYQDTNRSVAVNVLFLQILPGTRVPRGELIPLMVGSNLSYLSVGTFLQINLHLGRF
jgi:hypothetical protein